MDMTVKILICIDDKAESERISATLGETGFGNVSAAGSRAEAELGLRALKCNLVICDTRFDGGEGLGLIYSEASRGRQVRFVFLGAREQESLLGELCKRDGASFITRPYELGTLLAEVFRLAGELRGEEPIDGGDGESLEVPISRILHNIGIPAHIKGYAYLRSAIEMTVENPDIINFVTKSLYPSVARAFGTTTSRVERAIRHAIEVAWDRGDVETLDSYFGYTISRQRGKPTNSEFIAMIADKLRLGVIR